MPISETYRELRGDKLFHYTHENNIQSIIDHDYQIFSSNHINKKGITPSFITDSDSRNIDMIKGNNNYVFLIFSHSHPMIYRKEQEGIPLRYIEIDISILDIPGVKIADRVATDNRVTLYTPEKALEQLKIAYCHNGRVNDREIWDEVKKYEILIPGYIDLNKFLHKS